MGETGGKWALGAVVSKVPKENGGKWGKLRANGGCGCTESGARGKKGADGGWRVY